MKIYSDFAPRRTRQVIVDIAAVAAIAAGIWLGTWVYSLVMNLNVFGVRMEEAGAGFRETMMEVGSTLGNIPIIGGGVRTPFDDASAAGAALETAGQDQQVAVEQLATGLGVGIALLPILTILLLWLVPRLTFVRRASVARAQLRAGASLDLLALRALTSQRLSALSAIAPDPVASWRSGDERVIHALAGLELKASGVRLE